MAVQQAAAIPYRSGTFGVEVLLVTVRSGGWGIPKGGVKKGDTAQRTAKLECYEEAGALGPVDQSLGSFTFRKRGRRHAVEVFPLEVSRLLRRWAEDDRRSRVWVPITEAADLVKREALRPLFERLRARLLTRTGSVSRAA
jgi:8-oxo-dGTP pyrophosphatase MutT (NUDIX family)